MKKKMIITVVLAALLIGATGAQAFGAFNRGERFADKRLEKIAADLNLSQAQRERFTAASARMQAEAKALRQKNRELFSQIKTELLKDAPNLEAIHGPIKQIEQNRALMEISRVDRLIELRQSLTPEQKEKFKNLFNGRRGRLGKYAK